jgi:hypothetical protein
MLSQGWTLRIDRRTTYENLNIWGMHLALPVPNHIGRLHFGSKVSSGIRQLPLCLISTPWRFVGMYVMVKSFLPAKDRTHGVEPVTSHSTARYVVWNLFEQFELQLHLKIVWTRDTRWVEAHVVTATCARELHGAFPLTFRHIGSWCELAREAPACVT